MNISVVIGFIVTLDAIAKLTEDCKCLVQAFESLEDRMENIVWEEPDSNTGC
jgi:hypothetical protein